MSHRHRGPGIEHTEHSRQTRRDDDRDDRPNDRRAIDVERLTEVLVRVDPARWHCGSGQLNPTKMGSPMPGTRWIVSA